MRVSATDIDDGNNSVVYYSLSPKRPEDGVYFRIDRNTGVIFLNKTIDVSETFVQSEELFSMRRTKLVDRDFLSIFTESSGLQVQHDSDGPGPGRESKVERDRSGYSSGRVPQESPGIFAKACRADSIAGKFQRLRREYRAIKGCIEQRR